MTVSFTFPAGKVSWPSYRPSYTSARLAAMAPLLGGTLRFPYRVPAPRPSVVRGVGVAADSAAGVNASCSLPGVCPCSPGDHRQAYPPFPGESPPQRAPRGLCKAGDTAQYHRHHDSITSIRVRALVPWDRLAANLSRDHVTPPQPCPRPRLLLKSEAEQQKLPPPPRRPCRTPCPGSPTFGRLRSRLLGLRLTELRSAQNQLVPPLSSDMVRSSRLSELTATWTSRPLSSTPTMVPSTRLTSRLKCSPWRR